MNYRKKILCYLLNKNCENNLKYNPAKKYGLGGCVKDRPTW